MRKKPKVQAQRIRELLRYARPHRRTFGLVVCCAMIAVAADLLQPYLMKIAIDDNLMAEKNDFGTILMIGGIFLLLSVSGLLFSYWQNNLLQRAGQSIVARLRKELFEHISKLSMSYFDRVPSGSLITNVSSDTETVSQFFTQVLLSVVRDGLTLIFIVALMFQLDAELAAYCMLLLPVIAVIAVSFRTYMRKTYQLSRTQLSRLIAFVAENLAGMNLIQVFHQEKEQQKRFTDRNDSYFQANLREIRTNVLFYRSFDILGNLSIAFVTWIGGMAVFNKSLEFGVLYAFITYIRLFFQPINAITQQWNTLQATAVSVQRIWDIFALKPEVQDRECTVRLPADRIRGDIEFRKVTFGYNPDQPILTDLNVRIQPGEMVGIVGTTGAGKSTLISLLCRFYDVQQGAVVIDGVDIRDVAQQELQRLVGLVQQEPYLYSGSILENVRLFDQTITPKQVEEACMLVGADALIRKMKDGYNTRLTERGSGLSAGERQLISFARIIVFQPKILILDEATANLDSQTEQLIQRALGIVSEGRTTIVIAHRLSTIMQADRILVMRQGKVVEEGTHEQLLSMQGYYEQLYTHSQGKMNAGA